jgi:hypothetical protein
VAAVAKVYRRRVRRAIGLLVLATLFASGAFSAHASTQRPLVGTWRLSTSKITFKSDGRAVFNISSGTEILDEKWSATRTTVTFGPAGACPGKGTFSWKVSGRKLTLHPIRDACTIRAGILNGVWTKK